MFLLLVMDWPFGRRIIVPYQCAYVSLYPNWFGIPDEITAVRILFVTVAVWWGYFQ
ncbi:MAG: hypothetical protein CM15mP106_3810 [Candidatus Neomarinimicrobiota bacterium]|nr:MAG: hypothetical protein CM15mP106_3810 [Candidatus Neomarinimicrobiota bacterium]